MKNLVLLVFLLSESSWATVDGFIACGTVKSFNGKNVTMEIGHKKMKMLLKDNPQNLMANEHKCLHFVLAANSEKHGTRSVDSIPFTAREKKIASVFKNNEEAKKYYTELLAQLEVDKKKMK
jgi:hypothetical protein